MNSSYCNITYNKIPIRLIVLLSIILFFSVILYTVLNFALTISSSTKINLSVIIMETFKMYPLSTVFIVTMISFFLFTKKITFKNLNNLTYRAEKLFFNSIVSIYNKKQIFLKNVLIESLINVPDITKVTSEEQIELASEIINDIINNNKIYFYILGNSASGKTTILSTIIDKIIKNNYEIDLHNKVVFCDFNISLEDQDKFITNYQNKKYKNKIILIDNFHKLNNMSFKTFTLSLINKDADERAIIISSQYTNLFTKKDTSKLYNFFNLHGIIKEINTLHEVERKLYEIIHFDKSTHYTNYIENEKFSNMDLLNIVQMKMFMNGTDTKIIQEVFNLQTMKKNDLKFLAIVVSLSLNKASFSFVEIQIVLKYMSRNFFSYYLNIIKIYFWLSKLSKNAFIQRPILANQKMYMFHEKLAIYFKYKLKDINYSQEIMVNIINHKINESLLKENFLLSWLYEKDINSISNTSSNFYKLFDNAYFTLFFHPFHSQPSTFLSLKQASEIVA